MTDRLLSAKPLVVSQIVTSLAVILVTCYAAVMTNRGADLVDKHAATRAACAEFVVGRASMSMAGAELLRVMGESEQLDGRVVAEIQSKTAVFDEAKVIWLRANAGLLFIAEKELMAATQAHYTSVQAAVQGTQDYYNRLLAAGSGKAAGAPPVSLWTAVDNASQPVVDACKRQANSGSWWGPPW